MTCTIRNSLVAASQTAIQQSENNHLAAPCTDLEAMDRMKPVDGALCVCWIGAGQLRPHPSGKIRRVLRVSKAKQASEWGTPSVSHGVPAERPQGRTQASDSSPGANRAVRPARGGGSCCTIPDRAACESRGPAGRQGAGVLPRVRQRRVLQGGEQPRGRPAETRAFF